MNQLSIRLFFASEENQNLKLNHIHRSSSAVVQIQLYLQEEQLELKHLHAGE
ncbi:hypothetical protein GCM10007877_28890 [Marinibactrum halimedae]|uniref:Uncharacterized protein n=1 Tax=Marinibactrum halimedae TaxID=1444977 RepID=A0AA37WN93_9GAMM|nr:hypothetical protein GCM10007877_28890 [Marinibactrum halimedae]